MLSWTLKASVATLLTLCGTACADLDLVDGAIGCERAARDGAVHLQISVDALPRTYWLVAPEGYEAGTSMPVVFGWHGLGGEGDLARSDFGVEMEREVDGAALFVYPDAQPLPLVRRTGWDLEPDGTDVAFFDAMLEQLDDQSCLDRTSVYSIGHSFGGYMTSALGCYRPGDLRAIGVVEGGPPVADCKSDRVAAIVVHGESDEIVAIGEGRLERDELLARNRCSSTSVPVEPAPCVAYEGCDPGFDVRWCEHDERAKDGHAWPSFASAAIWDFFAPIPPK
ncbi:MAG TPA: hypothetical protein VFG69_13595 [Nannocystaceae bacterium]|nr:hypothetical protein [Nannocystaceae bacterium]